MTWLKMTSKALYLMAAGTDQYLQKVPVTPNSPVHPHEVGTELPTDWFASEAPRRLIVDLSASEPDPVDPAAGESADLG